MRPHVRCAPGTVVLLAACVAMAAGCAAAHPATGPAASPGPREHAVADAAAILRAFAVPPGARRLPQAPDALKVPITTLVSTTLVDDVSFWRAPGQPQAVLAWEQAHLPRRFTLGDADFGPPSWDRMFSLAPVPGVLTARDLVVEVTGAGHGQTAIRVDAQVSWQPPRPGRERVPGAARVVTITSPPAVRRIAALVDSLPLSTIGPGASCPGALGGGIRLTFRAQASGAPLAVAQGPAPCGTVQFSAGGARQPALQITDSFIPHILTLAGLHWKVP